MCDSFGNPAREFNTATKSSVKIKNITAPKTKPFKVVDFILTLDLNL
jgi:hypothetical protein